MSRVSGSRLLGLVASLLFVAGAATASDPPAEGPKVLSGMSIVGNDDAPKSLVIVPWKSSELGDVNQLSRSLDVGRSAVDREVFMRGLDYYEIRTSSHGVDGSGK